MQISRGGTSQAEGTVVEGPRLHLPVLALRTGEEAKAQECGGLQEQGEASRRIPPSEPAEGTQPCIKRSRLDFSPVTLVTDFQSPDFKKIHLCCFKPLSLTQLL